MSWRDGTTTCPDCGRDTAVRLVSDVDGDTAYVCHDHGAVLLDWTANVILHRAITEEDILNSPGQLTAGEEFEEVEIAQVVRICDDDATGLVCVTRATGSGQAARQIENVLGELFPLARADFCEEPELAISRSE